MLDGAGAGAGAGAGGGGGGKGGILISGGFSFGSPPKPLAPSWGAWAQCRGFVASLAARQAADLVSYTPLKIFGAFAMSACPSMRRPVAMPVPRRSRT